jgi:hypothetical protein
MLYLVVVTSSLSLFRSKVSSPRSWNSQLSFSAQTTQSTALFSSEQIKTKNVVIAGAGPAGLLAAHCLLQRGDQNACKYSVTLIESRGEPQLSEVGPRAYSLGLNIRGQRAIQHFDRNHLHNKLWDEISSRGVPSDAFYLHIGSNRFQLRKPSSSESLCPPTLLIARNKLCEGLLSVLKARYLYNAYKKRRLFIRYNTRLSSINLADKTCVISDGSTLNYDLLIGADGVNSVVRAALQAKSDKQLLMSSKADELPPDLFQSETVTLPGKYKVMLIDSLPAPASPQIAPLQRDAVHALENTKAGFGLFLIPGGNNSTCALLSWKSKSVPEAIAGEDTRSDASDQTLNADITHIKETLSTYYPQVGNLPDSSIKQLFQQRPSEAKTVKCSRYDDIEVMLNINTFLIMAL